MKVLIDTNVLISAALKPGSTPHLAYLKAVTSPNRGIVCETNIEELRRIFNRKFPSKLSAMDSFLAFAMTTLEVVPTPDEAEAKEGQMRDVKDRPILRAAIAANADLILTGDKDFLESGIDRPLSVTASEFLNMTDATAG